MREHFEAMHRNSGLTGFFEFVLTREDYQKSKPDPEPYLMALGRLRLPAHECVVVEDSERGLAAASAAGLRCIVIPSSLTRGGKFNGAAAILDNVFPLPSTLASLSVAPASVGAAGRPRS
jgi:beta-phosphoglucomutase-like phosphatase (HAD superfamily)